MSYFDLRSDHAECVSNTAICVISKLPFLVLLPRWWIARNVIFWCTTSRSTWFWTFPVLSESLKVSFNCQHAQKLYSIFFFLSLGELYCKGDANQVGEDCEAIVRKYFPTMHYEVMQKFFHPHQFCVRTGLNTQSEYFCILCFLQF